MSCRAGSKRTLLGAHSSIAYVDMSDNKRIVQRYLEGFRTTDRESILSCVTDDVEWNIRRLGNKSFWTITLVSTMLRRTWMFLPLTISAACSEPMDHLVVTLTADRQRAAFGDTVHLLATVHNPTASLAEIGHGCGPSLDFRVTDPSGVTISLLDGKVFICPLVDYHVIEPGETDSIPWVWSTPAKRGAYTIRSAIRTSAGLRNTSAPVRVDIE